MDHDYKPTLRRRIVNLVTSDAATALLITASVLSFTSVVGLYASSLQELTHKEVDVFASRPPPVWMALKPVRAQMSDGNMLAVKVSLQLSKTKSADELNDYAGVFGSLVERAGQHTSRKDLRSEDGIERFSIQIQRDLNDYLDEHDATPSRITGVLFDELVQLPG